MILDRVILDRDETILVTFVKGNQYWFTERVKLNPDVMSKEQKKHPSVYLLNDAELTEALCNTLQRKNQGYRIAIVNWWLFKAK